MASSSFRFLGLFVVLSCIIFNAASEDQNNVKLNTDTSSELANITGQPFENIGSDDRCLKYDNCEECAKFNCTWTLCQTEYHCAEQPAEECPVVACTNSTTTVEPPTTTPNDTTTTVPPTTTTDNSTTTTEPNTTTTSTTTTTTTSTTSTTPVPTNTTTPATPPTPVPTNTTTPSPTTPSTSEEPAPPPAPPRPHTRHFDAGSFIGGIILTITVTAVAFAAWKFYRRRALSTSYTNF